MCARRSLCLLFMPLLALTDSGSLGRHYIAMFEATQNVTLKPTENWREALLDTRVMDLFFTVSLPSVRWDCDTAAEPRRDVGGVSFRRRPALLLAAAAPVFPDQMVYRTVCISTLRLEPHLTPCLWRVSRFGSVCGFLGRTIKPIYDRGVVLLCVFLCTDLCV